MDNNDLSRRQFIHLSAGYALAALPVTSFALTPVVQVQEGEVSIPVGKAKMPAYWAYPRADRMPPPYPIVLVVQEIFGIHAYIQDVCRRFAMEGYLAVAPSLYFRQGDVTKVASVEEILKQFVSKVQQSEVMSDLDSTLDWAIQTGKGDPKRTLITGFCWGGGVTWMYAAHNPKLKAGVAWYGRLTGDKTELQPKFPIDIASELKVPVLGLYGGKDAGIPLEQVKKMKEALARGKSGSRIEVFPEAEHGFHADYRPSYHEKSAKIAWNETLEWFKSPGSK